MYIVGNVIKVTALIEKNDRFEEEMLPLKCTWKWTWPSATTFCPQILIKNGCHLTVLYNEQICVYVWLYSDL